MLNIWNPVGILDLCILDLGLFKCLWSQCTGVDVILTFSFSCAQGTHTLWNTLKVFNWIVILCHLRFYMQLVEQDKGYISSSLFFFNPLWWWGWFGQSRFWSPNNPSLSIFLTWSSMASLMSVDTTLRPVLLKRWSIENGKEKQFGCKWDKISGVYFFPYSPINRILWSMW